MNQHKTVRAGTEAELSRKVTWELNHGWECQGGVWRDGKDWCQTMIFPP